MRLADGWKELEWKRCKKRTLDLGTPTIAASKPTAHCPPPLSRMVRRRVRTRKKNFVQLPHWLRGFSAHTKQHAEKVCTIVGLAAHSRAINQGLRRNRRIGIGLSLPREAFFCVFLLLLHRGAARFSALPRCLFFSPSSPQACQDPRRVGISRTKAQLGWAIVLAILADRRRPSSWVSS